MICKNDCHFCCDLQIETVWKQEFTNEGTLPPLSSSCTTPLNPPPPDPPSNIILTSYLLEEINSEQYHIQAQLRWQQVNESNALLSDLQHEYIISSDPLAAQSTIEGIPFDSTSHEVNVFILLS